RPMDAEHRVAAAVVEIHGAGAERIARAAFHGDGQIRLTLAHLCRRGPGRPFGLAADPHAPAPAKTLAADADAITLRLPVGEHQVEVALPCVDNDGSRALA